MDDADGYFPERVAATYDDSSEGMFDPVFTDTVAEVLAGLAGGGRALELAIGTGRIALPLARRGVEVHGIGLGPDAVHRREPQARLGLGEGLGTATVPVRLALLQEGPHPFLRVGQLAGRRHDLEGVGVGLGLVQVDLGV